MAEAEILNMKHIHNMIWNDNHIYFKSEFAALKQRKTSIVIRNLFSIVY